MTIYKKTLLLQLALAKGMVVAIQVENDNQVALLNQVYPSREFTPLGHEAVLIEYSTGVVGPQFLPGDYRVVRADQYLTFEEAFEKDVLFVDETE